MRTGAHAAERSLNLVAARTAAQNLVAARTASQNSVPVMLLPAGSDKPADNKHENGSSSTRSFSFSLWSLCAQSAASACTACGARYVRVLLRALGLPALLFLGLRRHRPHLEVARAPGVPLVPGVLVEQEADSGRHHRSHRARPTPSEFPANPQMQPRSHQHRPQHTGPEEQQKQW